MEAPLPPGPRPPSRAPLPTVALLLGVTFCGLAVAAAFLRTTTEQLAHDALVMRALGTTLAMAGVMLGRVALRASAGMRQVAALAIALPQIALAVTLLAWPSGAALLYDRGFGPIVPWILGVPGILCLGLSRWRVG